MLTPPPELAALARASRLLAVDPGLRYPAAAVFAGGKLVRASRVKLPPSLSRFRGVRGLDEGEHCRQVAELVCAWAVEHLGALPELVVSEYPQVYPDEFKKDPNDLLPLAGIGVAVGARLCVRVVSPRPREWIGSIPKSKSGPAWQSPRGRLIASRMTALERALVEESHDAIDALGIGKWAQGGLGRVFAGTV